MPSKYRRDYEYYRQRLIALGSYCNRCQQPRQPHETELSYHHLIPKYLLTDHRYGVLVCRKCHPILLAEQRSEFRRVGSDGYPIYPYDPTKSRTLDLKQRMEVFKLWLKTCLTAPHDYDADSGLGQPN